MQAKHVKNLIGALSLVAIVAMLAAIPASAQPITFSVTSLAQTVRTEGQAETAGTVALTFSGAASTTIVAGSSITVAYAGAPVTSAGVVSGKIGGVACNVSSSAGVASAAGDCGELVGENNGAGGVATPATPPQIVYSASGSNVIIQFNVTTSISVGDYLNVQQVRLNIAQLTGALPPSASQTQLNATLSGNSPTGNPITFSNSSAAVATISPSLTVTGPSASHQIALTTCAAAATAFNVTISEVYTAAFTSQTDETAFTPGSAGPPVVNPPATNGATVNVVLSNIPAGFQVLAPGTVIINNGVGTSAGAGTSGTLALTGPSTTLVTSTGVTSSMTFTYTLTLDSTSAVETLVLPFTIGPPGTAAPSATATAVATLASNNVASPVTITAQAYLGPLSTSSAVIPRFTQLLYPSPAANIGTVSDCQSILLFPYVTNQLGFDTSIQIANTSADGAAFGTQAAIKQPGFCKLTLYGTNASTGVLQTAASTYSTPTIQPGGAVQVKMSTAYPSQSGYMFAVCNFLNAHAYSYFVGPGSNGGLITQGALALVVNANTRTAAAGESLTH
jgi:hypothetical protein